MLMSYNVYFQILSEEIYSATLNTPSNTLCPLHTVTFDKKHFILY